MLCRHSLTYKLAGSTVPHSTVTCELQNPKSMGACRDWLVVADRVFSQHELHKIRRRDSGASKMNRYKRYIFGFQSTIHAAASRRKRAWRCERPCVPQKQVSDRQRAWAKVV